MKTITAFVCGLALGLVVALAAGFYLVYKKVNAATKKAEAKLEGLEKDAKEITTSVKRELKVLSHRVDRMTQRVDKGLEKLDSVEIPSFLRKKKTGK